MGGLCIPGPAASPVILHVPHASRTIPPSVRRGLLLDDAALEAELDHLTDAWTDRIARSCDQAWIFENQLSRLVVDPERFPDDTEEMRAVGMGAVYTHGYAGRRLRAPVRDSALVTAYFEPYAEAMTSLVADRLAAAGRVVIVDVHSYSSKPLPYELHGDGPRPQICLGTDAFHTPAWLLSAAAAAFGGYSVEVNTPFAGCYVPLRYHGRSRDVSALMIEIRRDVYMDEPGGVPTAGLAAVAAALVGLVDEIAAR